MSVKYDKVLFYTEKFRIQIFVAIDFRLPIHRRSFPEEISLRVNARSRMVRLGFGFESTPKIFKGLNSTILKWRAIFPKVVGKEKVVLETSVKHFK